MLTKKDVRDYVATLLDGDYHCEWGVFVDIDYLSNGSMQINFTDPESEETQAFTVSVTPA